MKSKLMIKILLAFKNFLDKFETIPRVDDQPVLSSLSFAWGGYCHPNGGPCNAWINMKLIIATQTFITNLPTIKLYLWQDTPLQINIGLFKSYSSVYIALLLNRYQYIKKWNPLLRLSLFLLEFIHVRVTPNRAVNVNNIFIKVHQ